MRYLRPKSRLIESSNPLPSSLLPCIGKTDRLPLSSTFKFIGPRHRVYEVLDRKRALTLNTIIPRCV